MPSIIFSMPKTSWLRWQPKVARAKELKSNYPAVLFHPRVHGICGMSKWTIALDHRWYPSKVARRPPWIHRQSVQTHTSSNTTSAVNTNTVELNIPRTMISTQWVLQNAHGSPPKTPATRSSTIYQFNLEGYEGTASGMPFLSSSVVCT